MEIATRVAGRAHRRCKGKEVDLEDLRNEAWVAMAQALADPEELHDEAALEGVAREAAEALVRRMRGARKRRTVQIEDCGWLERSDSEKGVQAIEQADSVARAKRIAQIEADRRRVGRQVKLAGLLMHRYQDSVIITMPDGTTRSCRLRTVEKALRALLGR